MRGKTWEVTRWSGNITDSGTDEHRPTPPALQGAPILFRCLDDDRILYCEGVALDDAAAEEALDYMAADYGATILQYCQDKDGTWIDVIS